MLHVQQLEITRPDTLTTALIALLKRVETSYVGYITMREYKLLKKSLAVTYKNNMNGL